MSAKDSASREFSERFKAHVRRYGSSPIEDGTILNLADHECRHGWLPNDRKRNCDCFPRKVGKR